MNVRRLISLLSAGSCLAILAVGCAANSAGEDLAKVASQSERLTVLEADESIGKLVARFEKDGRAVTFELRLGPKMEVPQDDPRFPNHEVDARVNDAEGKTFYVQMGGDTFIDATWPARPPVVDVDPVQRLNDVAISRRAESAFATANIPASLEQLRLAAMEIARTMEHIADVDKPAAPPATTLPGGGVEGTLAPKQNVYRVSYAAYWDYMIYWKSTAVIAHHSAVRLRAWNSSKSFLAGYNSCNHGTCAGGSAMTSSCTYSGWLADDGTSSRYFFSEPSTSTGTVSGGCTTPYGVLSGSGMHNCNDDSRLQKKAITYDNYYCTNCNDDCGNNLADGWAPSCG